MELNRFEWNNMPDISKRIFDEMMLSEKVSDLV